MNFVKSIAAGMALAIALPAGATVVNFDTLPGGASVPTTGMLIGTQYASVGVSFSGTNTTNGNTISSLSAFGLSPVTGEGSVNALYNLGLIPAGGPSNYLIAPRFDVMTMTFVGGTASAVSFGLYTSGGQNSVNIIAYDTFGATLQTLSNVMANNGTYDLKSLSASGIAKINIVGQLLSGNPRIFSIDNLTYTLTPTASAVPEPASWAMMIGGLGLVGAGMRRRKVSAVLA